MRFWSLCVLFPLMLVNPFFSVKFQALCRGYPSEFASYFHYCRSLRFDDKPDYPYLKRLFRDLFIREGWFSIHTSVKGIFVPLLRNVQKIWVFKGDNCSYHCLAGFQFDYVFDWTILKYQQSQIASAPQRVHVSPTHKFSLFFPEFSALGGVADILIFLRVLGLDKALAWLLPW